jgi:hypothetical protein
MSPGLREIEYVTGFVNTTSKFQRTCHVRPIPVTTIAFNRFLVRALKFGLIQLQCILFGTFRGVGHIALMALFNAVNATVRTTTDKDFAKE